MKQCKYKIMICDDICRKSEEARQKSEEESKQHEDVRLEKHFMVNEYKDLLGMIKDLKHQDGLDEDYKADL